MGTENAPPSRTEVEFLGQTGIPGVIHVEQGQVWVSALAAQPQGKAPAARKDTSSSTGKDVPEVLSLS